MSDYMQMRSGKMLKKKEAMASRGLPRGSKELFRRTAEGTRLAILDAAERRLIKIGPEGIRLQDIAADAGISHPAILHHFGSREGLVEALVVHGLSGLQAEILAGWPSRKVPDIEGVLERFYRLAAGRGYARLLAALILSGRSLRGARRGIVRPLAERMHAARMRAALGEGRPEPEFEDSLFASVLLSITVFGDALFGPVVRKSVGLGPEPATGRRFRQWLVGVCQGLERGAAEQRARGPATTG